MEFRPNKRGGIFRYHPVGAKPINLGSDRDAAIRRVLDLTGRTDDFGTVRHLCRLYKESKHWRALAERTRQDYGLAEKQLLGVMGDAQAAAITQPIVRRYMMVERQGISRANHEAALLSNMLYHAVDLGWIPHNPLATLQYLERAGRASIPITDELPAFVAWLKERGKTWRIIAAMAMFAALSGARRSEFRTATLFQDSGQEIRLQRAKQRKKGITDIIEVSPELRAELDAVRHLVSTALFANRAGNPYTESGFNTMWNKAMRKALADRIITVRFTFHDLRAYYVTKHKARHGTLPDIHRNPQVTATVYDRSKEARRRGL